MKVNKILAFMFILELCIIPLQGICPTLFIMAFGYNKTDDSITSDVAWWFNLNIYYDKDSIVAYGYMMHPSDYDDIRVQITEYLNDLFKNA